MSTSLWIIDFFSVDIFRCYPSLARSILTGIIIIMPTIGYFDQLFKMIKTKNSRLFNRQTSYILLLSNYLRFIYWVFEPFEVYLLGQSIAVFIVMLLLSISSFYLEDNSHSFKTSMRMIAKSNNIITRLLHIQNTRNQYEFVLSLVLYSLTIVIFISILSLVIGLGSALSMILILSNIVDTLVSVPQFIKVVIKKDKKGCSVVLMIQYLVGDILKLLMFVLGGSQLAFIFGAILQSSIDTTIYFFYYMIKNDQILP